MVLFLLKGFLGFYGPKQVTKFTYVMRVNMMTFANSLHCQTFMHLWLNLQMIDRPCLFLCVSELTGEQSVPCLNVLELRKEESLPFL